MAIKFTVAKEEGGYVHSNGDIQIICIEGGKKHGEQAKCLLPQAHTHDKSCAVTALDVKPILEPAVQEDDSFDPPISAKPEVLGQSPRERATAWFAALAQAEANKPVPVVLPQKTVKVKNDKGKLVDKEVDDGDLA
jgi:hypothetical protein